MIEASMAALTPEAKKKIEDAYRTFEQAIRTIAHEHRTTVGALIEQVDTKVAESIKKKIGSS